MEARAQVRHRLRRLQRSEPGLAALTILERLPVERADLPAVLAVEAAAGLLAQVPALDHDLHEVRNAEHLAEGIGRDRVVEVGRDLRADVHAGDVGRAEGRAARAADGGTRERVHVLDREVEVDHGLQDGTEAERADAVADEVRRVLAAHDRLAQDLVGERLGGGQHAGIGVGSGDGLEQLQVARRVEEVRAQEAPAELEGQVRRHGADAQAGGVAGDDGGLLHRRRHAREELALDLQVLHHRLEDPVGVLELRPVVVEVARADARGVLGQVERARLQLAQVRDGPARDRGPVRRVLAHDVEQRDFDALRHQMGRDLRTHGAAAQDHRLLDVGLHRSPPTGRRSSRTNRPLFRQRRVRRPRPRTTGR
jgi:hypothetical protein